MWHDETRAAIHCYNTATYVAFTERFDSDQLAPQRLVKLATLRLYRALKFLRI